MSDHYCTGPGCPGCYAIANAPTYKRPPADPEYEAYLQREQEKWERSGRRERD